MAKRIHLGMLTPSSNTVLEPLTSAMIAGLPGVSAHFSRFPVTEISLAARATGQFDFGRILEAARLLAQARVAAGDHDVLHEPARRAARGGARGRTRHSRVRHGGDGGMEVVADRGRGHARGPRLGTVVSRSGLSGIKNFTNKNKSDSFSMCRLHEIAREIRGHDPAARAFVDGQDHALSNSPLITTPTVRPRDAGSARDAAIVIRICVEQEVTPSNRQPAANVT